MTPPPVAVRHAPEREPVRADSDELFDLEGEQAPVEGHTFKVGLLGGKQVGKSYLFQSMVYRTHGRDMGALSYYLSKANVRVYGRRYFDGTSDATADEKFRPIKSHLLIEEYQRWDRLGTTARTAQMWYRIHLPFRSGWIGRKRSDMEIRFLDGSGDHFQSGIQTEEDRKLWTDAFVEARAIVFCLPMWAAFPEYKALSDDQVVEREGFLKHFYGVVHTYEELRMASGAEHPVRVIIALTQADSPLCDGNTQRAWITPYVRNPKRYLRQLRTGGGVARYLASARAVSQYLCEICDQTNEQAVSKLLNLDYGCGAPWLIPVTAIDGEQLARVEANRVSDAERLRIGPPVPAHVELPLLIAMSDQHNALA